MTLDMRHVEWIEERGISLELAIKLGLDTMSDSGGLWLSAPLIEDGRPVNHKYRQVSKKRFKMDAGAPLTLWNRDVLLDNTLAAEPLIVTEGEMDALAALTCGKLRVVSVPNGTSGVGEDGAGIASPEGGKAYQYLWRNRPLLDPVKSVILAVDNDAPGLKLAADLARWFGPDRCRFVEYPEGCKDLNDVLIKHDQATVVRLLDAAKPYPVKGVYTFDDFPERAPVTEISTGITALDEHIKIVPGTFMVWTGYAGMGKSSLMLSVLANVLHQGHGIALGSFETMVKPVLQRKMRAALCQKSEWGLTDGDRAFADEILADRFRIIAQAVDDPEMEIDLSCLLDLAKTVVVRDDVRVLVIDPWNELEHKRNRDETETEYTGRAIRALRAFAANYDVAVIVVAHPAKPDTSRKLSPPGLYSISGSAQWANKPDYGLCVHQSDDDPESKVRDVIISKVRMGLPGRKGVVSLAYDPRTSTYAKARTLEEVEVGWNT